MHRRSAALTAVPRSGAESLAGHVTGAPAAPLPGNCDVRHADTTHKNAHSCWSTGGNCPRLYGNAPSGPPPASRIWGLRQTRLSRRVRRQSEREKSLPPVLCAVLERVPRNARPFQLPHRFRGVCNRGAERQCAHPSAVLARRPEATRPHVAPRLAELRAL
jgi:hypothetical protein